ncbi:uncharacterised protein [Saccharolobus solfataricus]|uniref:Uncharacterized protein n=1 Tax=Saccharolobus solfataricus TaxID=2287 RepID=A0A157SZ64_SACSO|nr:uncharacterised protein [Saccharolobus solfataricus]
MSLYIIEISLISSSLVSISNDSFFLNSLFTFTLSVIALRPTLSSIIFTVTLYFRIISRTRTGYSKLLVILRILPVNFTTKGFMIMNIVFRVLCLIVVKKRRLTRTRLEPKWPQVK